MKQLLESAKDLTIYKKLLSLFAEFIDRNPATGMGKVYKQFLDAGLKCVPKDKRALEILDLILTENAPKSIQELMNTNFTELPVLVRPIYKNGNSKLTAFWMKGDKLFSKVFDLMNLDGTPKGVWVDEKGNKVSLIDLGVKED